MAANLPENALALANLAEPVDSLTSYLSSNPNADKVDAPRRNPAVCGCSGELRKEFVKHENSQLCRDAPSIGTGASERQCTT